LAVQTSSRHTLGSAQSPRLPASALKQVSPRARLVPLQRELLSVTVVQVYGLQQVLERLCSLSRQRSPAWPSQNSVVVVVVVVVDVVVVVVVLAVVVVVVVVVVVAVVVVVTVVVVVVVTVVVVVVTVVVVVVTVVVVVGVVVVVVVAAEHTPPTQLSPAAVSHFPCLLPHRPLTGRGSAYWQYQSSAPVRVAPAASQGWHLVPEQHESPVKPMGAEALKHLASPGSWQAPCT